MARETLAGWFRENPTARRVTIGWALARLRGQTNLGARQVIPFLAEKYGFPFKDHTILNAWSRDPETLALSEDGWSDDLVELWQDAFFDGGAIIEEPEVLPQLPLNEIRVGDSQHVSRLQDAEVIICASAQNNTATDDRWWQTVLAIQADRGAEIAVGPVRYSNPTSMRSPMEERDEKYWWDRKVEPYLCDEVVDLGPDLEINFRRRIQATSPDPLPKSLWGRSKAKSCVYAHGQLRMVTVPTPQNELPKILYATGSVSQENYSLTAAGDNGQFAHTKSVVLIERPRGKDRFHLREILWDEKSQTAIDLDREYAPSQYYSARSAPRAKALVTGDLHLRKTDPVAVACVFGSASKLVDIARQASGIMHMGLAPISPSMVELLDPEVIVMHDTFDGETVNRHERDNQLKQWQLVAEDRHTVEEELEELRAFLNHIDRPVIMPYSNHDDFLMKWLDLVNRPEPYNRKIWHELSLMCMRHWEDNDDLGNPVAHWMRSRGLGDHVRYLDPDESFLIGDNELGMHGHLGSNGARGSVKGLSYIGCKPSIGHVHSPEIWRNVAAVGMTAQYRHGYNKGPSSWLQTQLQIQANDKRQMLHTIGRFWHGRY